MVGDESRLGGGRAEALMDGERALAMLEKGRSHWLCGLGGSVRQSVESLICETTSDDESHLETDDVSIDLVDLAERPDLGTVERRGGLRETERVAKGRLEGGENDGERCGGEIEKEVCSWFPSVIDSDRRRRRLVQEVKGLCFCANSMLVVAEHGSRLLQCRRS